jgi:hypothetical protein
MRKRANQRKLTMSGNVEDSRWMDERDSEIQLGLKCDVELTIERGDTYRQILAEAARALRTTAAQLEGGKLEEGFHPLKALTGEEIGEVYVDYYGTM